MVLSKRIQHFAANWVSVVEALPLENLKVETKIDDENGIRNERPLIRQKSLWFNPGKGGFCSTYVYYSPTHWRSIKNKPQEYYR